MKEHTVDTKAAILELEPSGILVLHFKEGVRIDQAMVLETIAKRVELAAGLKVPVLSIMAPDQDFHIEVPITDNTPLLVGHTLAEAVVAPGFLLKVARLHYHNFPHPFPTAVLQDEEEAKVWLLAQREQLL